MADVVCLPGHQCFTDTSCSDNIIHTCPNYNVLS